MAETLPTGPEAQVAAPADSADRHLRACPDCGADNRRGAVHPLSRGPWRVKRCGRCGFVYLENPPEYEALSETFAWEKTIAAEALHREDARPMGYRVSKATRFRMALFPRKRVNNLIARYADPGMVVDIGCADAYHLTTLPPEFSPWGIEISADLAARGSANLAGRGKVVHASALGGLSALPEGRFTAVIQRSFLEHEREPRKVLAGSFRVLAPNGVLILKLPNYGSINARVMGRKWCGVRLPDHVNYFTPPQLRRFVQDAGFVVLRFDPFFFRQPTSDNMWLLARRPVGS